MRFRSLFLLTLSLLVFYTFLCVNRLLPEHKLLSMLLSAASVVFIIRFQLFHRQADTQTLSDSILIWLSSFGLGLWSSFIIFCIFIDSANFLLMIPQIFGMQSIANQDYWTSQAIKLSFIVSLVTSSIGLFQAVRGPVVKKIIVPIPALPPELVGLKIAQLSDLHIGAIIQDNYISNVVTKTLSLSPDIIVITGDTADGQPEALHQYTAPLAQLKAPLGVYFITGNHEYYHGAPGWIAEAQRLGLTPLINENRVLDYKQKKVMVAGVTDISAHRFMPEHASDPAKAIASHTPSDVKILLAHQPESYVGAQAAGFDLQLSGHTHAGQYFPFSILVKLAKRYARGLHCYKTLWIYVNPGTGFWGAANRFGVPAEITLLELAQG